MASKQVKLQPGVLKLGDGFDNHYEAIANQEAITEAGKLLKTIGSQLNATPVVKARRLERQESETNDRSSGRIPLLSRFVAVVDTILEWLENSGKSMTSNLQKLEAVLRGFFHVTELANQVNLFEILEFARSFLDVPEDPFPGQRQYIVKCLEDVEEQKQRISQLADKASRILTEIIENDEVDLMKGKQFDNIVREAHVQIDSCRRRLSGAERTILELSTKMDTVKWFSRSVRFTGWVVTCYCFYQKYQEWREESTMGLLVLFVLSVVAGLLWFSLFPSRLCVYYESLPKLASEHRLLNEQLEDLRVSLKSSKDHKDGL